MNKLECVLEAPLSKALSQDAKLPIADALRMIGAAGRIFVTICSPSAFMSCWVEVGFSAALP